MIDYPGADGRVKIDEHGVFNHEQGTRYKVVGALLWQVTSSGARQLVQVPRVACTLYLPRLSTRRVVRVTHPYLLSSPNTCRVPPDSQHLCFHHFVLLIPIITCVFITFRLSSHNSLLLHITFASHPLCCSSRYCPSHCSSSLFIESFTPPPRGILVLLYALHHLFHLLLLHSSTHPQELTISSLGIHISIISYQQLPSHLVNHPLRSFTTKTPITPHCTNI